MNVEEYERMYLNEGDYWWYVGRRDLVLTLLKDWDRAHENLKILDVGCGTGAMATELKRYGEVIACDLMPMSLEYCRKRDLDQLVCGDVTKLPFEDASFDLIVALDILEHVEDDIAAMSELRRVLKPDGRLVVTVPAYRFLWSNHDVALMHYRRYTAGLLKKRLQSVGFQIKKASYAVTFLFPLIVMMRLLSKWKDKNKKPEASVVPVSPWLNRFLKKLQHAEGKLVNKLSLPFGVTVVAVMEPRRSA